MNEGQLDQETKFKALLNRIREKEGAREQLTPCLLKGTCQVRNPAHTGTASRQPSDTLPSTGA